MHYKVHGKMKQSIWLVFFVITFTSLVYGQERVERDYVVTILDDTIFGEIEETNIYMAGNILISQNGEEPQKFNVRKLSSMQFEDQQYVRLCFISNSEKPNVRYQGNFLDPVIDSGSIRVYKKNQRLTLIKGQQLLNRNSLQYFADDFDSLNIRNIPKDSVLAFVKAYNDLKLQNPNSQSFAEKNLHRKKWFNPQIAVNVSATHFTYLYLGSELGLNKALTISPRLSALPMYKDDDQKTRAFTYFAEVAAKYYFANARRIKHEKSTFKYSGVYLATTYMLPLENGFTQNLKFEFGSKQVLFNNVYLDISIGTLYSIENGSFVLWHLLGFGYSF
jgi:hypothetical protein